jgi:hypothetical protein
MADMAKYIIAIIALILVIGGGYYLWTNNGTEPVVEDQPLQEQLPITNTYASTTLGVSVTYPSDFMVDETHQYTGVSPTKPIPGVKFVIPAAMTSGTNLSADSYIAVETLPRAASCVGDIFLAANVRSQDLTEGTYTYAVASSTGAAA